MKKLLTCVLALVFVLGMSVTTFASSNSFTTACGLDVVMSGTGSNITFTIDGNIVAGTRVTRQGSGEYWDLTLTNNKIMRVLVQGNDVQTNSAWGGASYNIRTETPPIPGIRYEFKAYTPETVNTVYTGQVSTTRALTAANVTMHIHQSQGNQNNVTFGATGNVLVTTHTTATRVVTVQDRERQFNLDTNEFFGEIRNTNAPPRDLPAEVVSVGTTVDTINEGTITVGTTTKNVPHTFTEVVVPTRNNSADFAVVGPFRINFETIGNTNVRALSSAVVSGSVAVGEGNVVVNSPDITFSQPTWTMHNGRSGVSNWNPQGNVRNNPQPW